MSASKRFLQPLNLLNASEDPSSASAGDFYYNTTLKQTRFYDGTSWQTVGASADAKFTVSSNPPSNPNTGDGWFDNTVGSFYIYDGTYWVEAANLLQVDLVEDETPQLGGNLDAQNYDITSLNVIQFDSTLSEPSIPGSLYWNSEEGTLDLVMENEVKQSIGMEFYMPPTNNNSGAVIPNGSFVMATGAQGDKITIAKAVTDGSVDSSYMIGIATEEIAIGSESGLVTVNGIVRGLNTSAWPVGTVLYPNPSVAGGLTSTKPNAPSIRTPVAIVLRQQTNTGMIYVRMTNGSKFGETDSNVQFGTLSDGDRIIYNSETSRWENTPKQVLATWGDLKNGIQA